jgi:hypothetical protein
VVRTSCNATTGAFSASVQVSAADAVLVAWLDPFVAGDRGAAYTRIANTTAPITGLGVVLGRVGLRSESGTALTNASIDTWDADQDGDIPITATGASVTVAAAQLAVRSGANFTPGGSVTAPSVRVLAGGTWTAGANTLTTTGGGTGACDSGTAPAVCVEGTLAAGTGVVRVQSTASTQVRGDATFATLELVPGSGSPTIDLRGTQTFATLLVGNGTNAVTAGTSWNPTLTVTGTTTVAAGATLSFTGTGPLVAQGTLVVDGSFAGSGTGTVTAR